MAHYHVAVHARAYARAHPQVIGDGGGFAHVHVDAVDAQRAGGRDHGLVVTILHQQRTLHPGEAWRRGVDERSVPHRHFAHVGGGDDITHQVAAGDGPAAGLLDQPQLRQALFDLHAHGGAATDRFGCRQVTDLVSEAVNPIEAGRRRVAADAITACGLAMLRRHQHRQARRIQRRAGAAVIGQHVDRHAVLVAFGFVIQHFQLVALGGHRYGGRRAGLGIGHRAHLVLEAVLSAVVLRGDVGDRAVFPD